MRKIMPPRPEPLARLASDTATMLIHNLNISPRCPIPMILDDRTAITNHEAIARWVKELMRREGVAPVGESLGHFEKRLERTIVQWMYDNGAALV